jgi:hypothetical protein
MNHYTTHLVQATPNSNKLPSPSFHHDAAHQLSFHKEWKESRSAWLRVIHTITIPAYATEQQ